MISKQLDANHTSATITRAPQSPFPHFAPERLEVIENPVTTSPTAGAFPMLVLGPKVALRHPLSFCALYLGVNSHCSINADGHEVRLWPGKGGRQIPLRHSKGCTIGEVEDHRKEWRCSLPRTLAGEWRLRRHQQGLQTAPQSSASHRCSWTVCLT